jgi:xylan 1,4-beta-xylosidase
VVDSRARFRSRRARGEACASLVASFALGCSSANPQGSPSAPGAISISVDGTSPGLHVDPIWAFHGYDEVNYTTTAEGSALLGVLGSNYAAPAHVRNHFLFNTGDGSPRMKWGSTNVYTEDASGTPVYDWTLTDQILDTITEAGAFPFVELGFMPQALSTHPVPYESSGGIALNSGSFYPPTDYAKWAALVGAWAAHVNERYTDVATNWPWELWNEPDSGYWRGGFDEYAKLYDYTEHALHDAVADAQLGGPAVIAPNGPFLTQFLEHCANGTNAATGETGTRLDLVTFHAKGGVTVGHEGVTLDLGHQLQLHRAGFEAVAAQPVFAHTPIYITEADPDGCAACPPNIVAGAAYRTSNAYGAYEVAMMKHTLELEAELGVELAGLLTWAFTFPEAGYFAGFRELATHGINLPVLSAFTLLGQLDGARLPLTSSGARGLTDILEHGVRGQPDIDGLATIDDSRIRVLVWNYHDVLAAAPADTVHLAIKVPASFGTNLRLSHFRVDDTHGNAHAVWVAQGMPESPTPEQLDAMQQAMAPASLSPDDTIAVDDSGSVGVDFELPRFGVSLVTLTRATARGD